MPSRVAFEVGVAVALAWPAAPLASRPVHLGASVPMHEMHAMHSSVTRVSYDGAARALEVSMRLFTDDFTTAVSRRTGTRYTVATGMSDDAVVAYARAALSVRDGTRPAVSFTCCGQRRELDFTWVCLRAALPDEPAQLDVSNRALHELFDDQVNIVQLVLRGRTRTLVFTRDDGMQRGP